MGASHRVGLGIGLGLGLGLGLVTDTEYVTMYENKKAELSQR